MERKDGWSGSWKLLGAGRAGGGEQLVIGLRRNHCQIVMILPYIVKLDGSQDTSRVSWENCFRKMSCEKHWSQEPRGPEFLSSSSRDHFLHPGLCLSLTLT
jgi:hypothetical protein